MKRFVFLFCISVLLFSASTLSYSFGSQNAYKVLINGTKTDIDLKIMNNIPYVDAIAYSQSIGLKANLDKTSGSLNVSLISNDILIPEIIKNLSPSVVGIVGKYNDGSYNSNAYQEDIVHGTGLIIKSNGEILTNAHVVKNIGTIVVIMSNGEGYIAKLEHMDEDSDLAVVKIDKANLPVAKFGTENEIITGKTVIAIGTPVSLSLRNSASTGVISGVNRGIDSYYKLIQTDASINPGNSGGPLVSLQGNVIGINSSKFSGTGIEGLGFSISLDTVKYVLGQFDKYGYVKRPLFGADFEEDWAAKIGLPSTTGLKITRVEENSPAKVGGLQEGDVLLKIGNTNISTIIDYNEVMKSYASQDRMEITIKRGLVSKILKITLA